MEDILSKIVRGDNSWTYIDELKFRDWYSNIANQLKLNPNPDDPLHFYDYRAAYRNGAVPDESGHWPSEFKIEGHPRMVIDGVNTKTGKKVR